MAAVLNKSPNSVSPVYNDVEWIVSLTDVGVENVNSIKFGYRVEDTLGNILIEEESIAIPVAGMQVPLDFTHDLRSLVQTMVPKASQIIAVQDELFSLGIKLVYGTIETDLLTCESTNNVNISSTVVTIINAAHQSTEQGLIDFDLPNVLLSHVPISQIQCRGGRNFIWIWNGSSVKVCSNLDSCVNFTNIAKAGVYPINVNLLPTPENISRLTVYLDNVLLTTINIVDCGCNTDSFATERNIMFLDAKGGRYNIHFTEFETYDMSTDFEVIQKLERSTPQVTFANDNNKLYTVGGETIINKVNRNSITLVHSIPIDKYNNNTEFYKAFLASSGYHIQVRNAQGQIDFHKFIISSGTFGYKRSDDEIDLVITGYMSPTYRTQTIDR